MQSANNPAISESEGVSELQILNSQITACRKCPRLVSHREQIGVIQRRAYRGQEYWCKPVSGFGDPQGRLFIVGLAPGAHGANRTGRIFTGDRSGEYLYRALFEAGFANQPESVSRQDGLALRDAYITSPVRCVPPDNKPSREEIVQCRPYLVRELTLLKNVRVVVALGAIALEAYLSVLQESSLIRSKAPFRFAHGAVFSYGENRPLILASYHPSQQNTSTRRLTREMLRDIFLRARRLIEEGGSSASNGTAAGRPD
ncbi:MAG TPA: uracil-DNA glycosylase [Bryobacteraceae bacterium]|nr:uracil-DNA glycosylase [Bryobacteraceae bacterium]